MRRIALRTERAPNGGGSAACAPPPCPLTPQRSEGPPQPRQVGYGSGTSPDALPLRALATTRRRPPQRPNGTPRSNVGRKLSVRTCTARANCSGSPARIIFGEISGTRLLKYSEFAANPSTCHSSATRCYCASAPPSFATSQPLVPHDSFARLSPEHLPPITPEISFRTHTSSFSGHAPSNILHVTVRRLSMAANRRLPVALQILREARPRS